MCKSDVYSTCLNICAQMQHNLSLALFCFIFCCFVVFWRVLVDVWSQFHSNSQGVPIRGTTGVDTFKKDSSPINDSLSCRSRPERPMFIFGTQIKIFLMKSKSFLNLTRRRHSRECSCYSCECASKTDTGVLLLNKVIFVFFVHKKYSRNFITLRLNLWCLMNYFTDVLTPLLVLERFNCIAVYARSESSQISSKIS